jgi:hypothetical protein
MECIPWWLVEEVAGGSRKLVIYMILMMLVTLMGMETFQIPTTCQDAVVDITLLLPHIGFHPLWIPAANCKIAMEACS